MTVTLRPAAARGHANHGWLDSWHSFSFADYFDPAHMGFRTLRVINDDTIAPDNGFGTHGHRDMEIITYVTHGAIEHQDSTGEHEVLRPGEVQRMSAGRGIRHSEFNPSKDEDTRLLQIWILPEREGITPGYEQKPFADAVKHNRLGLLASNDARDGSLKIFQDADVYAARLEPSVNVSLPLRAGRGAWVQVVEGMLQLGGQVLNAGDGAAIEGEPEVSLTALSFAEFLLFDLG